MVTGAKSCDVYIQFLHRYNKYVSIKGNNLSKASNVSSIYIFLYLFSVIWLKEGCSLDKSSSRSYASLVYPIPSDRYFLVSILV